MLFLWCCSTVMLLTLIGTIAKEWEERPRHSVLSVCQFVELYQSGLLLPQQRTSHLSPLFFDMTLKFYLYKMIAVIKVYMLSSHGTSANEIVPQEFEIGALVKNPNIS